MEDALADELSQARANAQRWASAGSSFCHLLLGVQVAKRQDAMLQQEREEQRGDAQSILAKHPAGEVFWSPLGLLFRALGSELPGSHLTARAMRSLEEDRGRRKSPWVAVTRSFVALWCSSKALCRTLIGRRKPKIERGPIPPHLSCSQRVCAQAKDSASSGDSLDLPGTGPATLL